MNELAPYVFDDPSGEMPNAKLLFNILTAIDDSQRGTGVKLTHRIKYVRGGQVITLTVMHLVALKSTDITVLRQLSPRVRSVQFQFIAPDTGDALAYGMVSIDVLHSSVTKQLPVVLYTEPANPRERTADYDWDDAGVPEDDREFVAGVVDKVYNMHQEMPLGMKMNTEPLHDADFSKTPSSSSARKRKTDVSEVESSAAVSANVIGCCIHFSAVPSFEADFLEFMARKYGPRWLGATVIFPCIRRCEDEDVFFPPQLFVSVSLAQAINRDAKAYATIGAKRLCSKLNGAVVVEDDDE